MIALPWFRIGAGVALAGALVAGALSIRHAYTERDNLRTEVASLAEQSRIVKRSTSATIDAITKRADDRVRIVTVTKEVLREVPQLIPAGSPELPPGFRVLHDAAATGALPGTPGGADAAPVPAEDAAAAVIGNYGTCLDTINQLERLQQWITEQSPSTTASPR